MAEAVPETIDKATAFVQAAARPNVLITIFALVSLAGCCFLVWRDEVRADAQIHVLESMRDEIRGVKDEQREQRRAFTAAGIRVRVAAPAVVREPVE